ncbi:cysteine desulfurase [Candidatus Woesearchaeota archaeon]|nr:cysteine desulfurase [Candidatus Woesearchaeota archaeon]
MKQVYLDNAATTMTDPVVVKAMLPYLTISYGNPSSPHELGKEAQDAIENARKIIAAKINAKPEEIIFTGSATEADNLAVKGIAYANKSKGRHIITSKIEHKAILESCKALEAEGFSVTYLGVSREGLVNPQDVKKAIRKDTILVSIMHANNEIGTVQDIAAIGKLCKSAGIYFHTDAAQSFTKIPIDVRAINIDALTLSAHKIHGPKGIGALYIKQGTKTHPIIHGGSQESAMRAGTEHVANIVGFAAAANASSQQDIRKMAMLRDYFTRELLRLPKVTINGSKIRRLCNNINAAFHGIDAETMLNHLNSRGIFASSGSACTASELEPSHVLKAIGLSDEAANSSIRFSLSKFTTKHDIDYAIALIREIVSSLRSINAVNKIYISK